MAYTPNIPLPIMDAASPQAQTLDYNETAYLLDALLPGNVVDDSLNTPPATPAAGACYIVAAIAVGAWAGWEDSIAAFIGGGWVQITPSAGWVRYVQATGRTVVFTTGWGPSTPHNFGVDFYGLPAPSEVLGRAYAAADITCAANFAGSFGGIESNPAVPFAIDVQDDGVSIGTVSISTAGVVTFSTVGGLAVTIAGGSKITFIAPAIADITAAGITISIAGLA